MNVEAALAEKIGEPAGRLRAGRSRNDQVATDFRLWVRDAIDAFDHQLKDLQRALIEKAEAHSDTVLPGSRICSPRSRSHLVIICSLMSKWLAGTGDASLMLANA